MERPAGFEPASTRGGSKEQTSSPRDYAIRKVRWGTVDADFRQNSDARILGGRGPDPRHATLARWLHGTHRPLALVRSIRSLHHQRIRGNVRIRSGPKAVAFQTRKPNPSPRGWDSRETRGKGKEGETHCRRGALTGMARRHSGSFHPPRHRWTASVLAPFPPAGPALRALASYAMRAPRDPGLPSWQSPGAISRRCGGQQKTLRSVWLGRVRVNGRFGSLMRNRSQEPGWRR